MVELMISHARGFKSIKQCVKTSFKLQDYESVSMNEIAYLKDIEILCAAARVHEICSYKEY